MNASSLKMGSKLQLLKNRTCWALIAISVLLIVLKLVGPFQAIATLATPAIVIKLALQIKRTARNNRLQRTIQALAKSYCLVNGYDIQEWIVSNTVAIRDLSCGTAGWTSYSSLRRDNCGHVIRNVDYWLRRDWSPDTTVLIGRDLSNRLFALSISDNDAELADPINSMGATEVHYLGRINFPVG